MTSTDNAPNSVGASRDDAAARPASLSAAGMPQQSFSQKTFGKVGELSSREPRCPSWKLGWVHCELRRIFYFSPRRCNYLIWSKRTAPVNAIPKSLVFYYQATISPHLLVSFSSLPRTRWPTWSSHSAFAIPAKQETGGNNA